MYLNSTQSLGCDVLIAVIKMDRTTFTGTNFESNGHVKSYKISMVCLTLCSERLHTGKMDRPQSNFQPVYVTATMSLLQLPDTLLQNSI